MSEERFSLQPFERSEPPLPWTISGSVSKQSGILAVSYTVLGDLREMDIPAGEDRSIRRDRLWEETCFELFLARRGDSPYWEVNLSPAGHWNVYRFDSYRTGMREESAVASLPFGVWRGPHTLRLAVELHLDGIGAEANTLEIGLSAVVRSRSGRLDFYALTHGGARADFHRRDGFLIVL